MKATIENAMQALLENTKVTKAIKALSESFKELDQEPLEKESLLLKIIHLFNSCKDSEISDKEKNNIFIQVLNDCAPHVAAFITDLLKVKVVKKIKGNIKKIITETMDELKKEPVEPIPPTPTPKERSSETAFRQLIASSLTPRQSATVGEDDDEEWLDSSPVKDPTPPAKRASVPAFSSSTYETSPTPPAKRASVPAFSSTPPAAEGMQTRARKHQQTPSFTLADGIRMKDSGLDEIFAKRRAATDAAATTHEFLPRPAEDPMSHRGMPRMHSETASFIPKDLAASREFVDRFQRNRGGLKPIAVPTANRKQKSSPKIRQMVKLNPVRLPTTPVSPSLYSSSPAFVPEGMSPVSPLPAVRSPLPTATPLIFSPMPFSPQTPISMFAQTFTELTFERAESPESRQPNKRRRTLTSEAMVVEVEPTHVATPTTPNTMPAPRTPAPSPRTPARRLSSIPKRATNTLTPALTLTPASPPSESPVPPPVLQTPNATATSTPERPRTRLSLKTPNTVVAPMQPVTPVAPTAVRALRFSPSPRRSPVNAQVAVNVPNQLVVTPLASPKRDQKRKSSQMELAPMNEQAEKERQRTILRKCGL